MSFIGEVKKHITISLCGDMNIDNYKNWKHQFSAITSSR